MKSITLTEQINMRFKGYSRTSLGLLPNDWKIVKLSEYIESLDAGVSVNSEDCPANPPEKGILKTSAVNDGRFFPTENKLIKPNEIHRAKLNPIKDSIIISRMNTPELVGEIGYVDKDYPHLFLPDRLWQTRYKGNVCGKWLAYLLTIPNLKRQIKNIATGTSNSMKNISKTAFLSLEIPLVPINEQQKIADILSTWDKAIELKEKLIEQKKEQKKSLMQRLLTGKVRLPGFEGEWKKVRLGSIGSAYNGLTGKNKEDFGSGKPYIPYKNVFNGSRINIDQLEYVQISETEKQNKVKYGDIIFTTSSETPEEVGMSSVLLDHVDELYLNSFCFGYRLNDFNTLIPEFAQYLFRGNVFRKELLKLAQGSTRFNLSKNEVLKIKIKIPGLEEQKKIASVLTIFDREIDLLEQELESLNQQKKGLMQLLLTGKVRVKC